MQLRDGLVSSLSLTVASSRQAGYLPVALSAVMGTRRLHSIAFLAPIANALGIRRCIRRLLCLCIISRITLCQTLW